MSGLISSVGKVPVASDWFMMDTRVGTGTSRFFLITENGDWI